MPRTIPNPDCRCRKNEKNEATEIWVNDGLDQRGQMRVVCRFCKRFVGYRRKEGEQTKKAIKSESEYD